MRDDYDFSNGIKNPYADKLKKQITIRLDDEVINYFKNMAEETGMPYQNIINYYLKDCLKEKRHLEVAFRKQTMQAYPFLITIKKIVQVCMSECVII